MQNVRRRMVGVGLVAFALVVVLVVGGILWRETPSVPDEEGVTDLTPGLQLSNVRFVGHRDGQRQWQIVSPSMLQQGDVGHLGTITEGQVFRESRTPLLFKADGGIWHKSSNDLELIGNVVVRDEDSLTMFTEMLVWHASKEELSSPQPVVLQFQGADITADTMIIHVPDQLVTLRGDVVVVEEGQVWKMDKVVYNMEREIMELYGPLTMELSGGRER